MARERTLRGVVKPSVDERRMEREVGRFEGAMEQAAQITPNIDLSGIRRQLSRLPGSSLLGGGGGGGRSTGTGDLLEQQLSELTEIRQTLEKQAVSGGDGGGGGGLGIGALAGTLLGGGGLGALASGGLLGGGLLGALGLDKLSRKLIPDDLRKFLNQSKNFRESPMGLQMFNPIELGRTFGEIAYSELEKRVGSITLPKTLETLVNGGWPDLPDLPQSIQNFSWPDLPEPPWVSKLTQEAQDLNTRAQFVGGGRGDRIDPREGKSLSGGDARLLTAANAKRQQNAPQMFGVSTTEIENVFQQVERDIEQGIRNAGESLDLQRIVERELRKQFGIDI